MGKRSKITISNGEPLSSLLDGSNLTTFKRDTGIPEKQSNVRYLYFLYLCELVGLNGPNPKQQYRMKETDDKTYFVLAWKLFDTRYKVLVDRDDNRVIDARCIRDRFALLNSSFQEYTSLDTPGASILEVLVALVERFDTEVMMDENEIDRSKEWFWEMMKNCGLDIFIDSGFNEEDNYAHEQCNSIIELVNSREYDEHGHGGYFPVKSDKYDQRRRELWFQMHDYFLENHIE